MRKVTKVTVEAFLAGREARCGNTVSTGDRLLLHGNVIAEWRGGNVYATLAGWPTVTTRERLNGLCRLLNYGGFNQHKLEQYFNGRPVGTDEWVQLTYNGGNDNEV